MNHKLKRTISLAILALTLTNTVSPVTKILAYSNDSQVSTVTGKSENNNGIITSGNTQNNLPNSANNVDLSKLPTLIPSTFDVPDAPSAGEPGSRLSLDKYNDNTRDMGGYVTSDGKWKIKSNRLIRSAHLNKFSDSDIKVLQDHNLKHIVDLRTPGQINSRKDVIIPGTTWENISILGNYADGGYNTDINGDYTNNKTRDGGFYNHQLEFSQSAMTGYNKFLNGLLTQDGATLFHCSSGKDRTGIGAVLIMSALGIDTQTIAKDYMLSMTYNHSVKYSWLKEYYREINAYYKNMQRYLVEGLDFSSYQQELLKSKYLVSNDDSEKAYPAPAEYKETVVTNSSNVDFTLVKSTQETNADKSNKDKPADDLQSNKSVDKNAKSRGNAKIISVKKIKKSEFVNLKSLRPYFYDIHLNHKVGKTALNSKTKWKVLKIAKIKDNGKVKKYIQVKNNLGYHRWILIKNTIHIK